MTVPATTRRAGPFTGNGVTTSFPFTFKVFETSDIQFTTADADGLETARVLGSDYSVTLNGDQDASPGGSVTYPISGTPLAAGHTAAITGAVEYTQELDLPGGGGFSPTALENALDRTTMQIQQLAEEVGRSLTLPITAADADAELPTPEAGKVIAWNSAGTGLVNVDSADLASVVVAGTSYTNIFSGTGAQTAFTLTADPGSVNALDVAISGVSQVNGVDFTVSGTTLTFTTAPVAGTGNVTVRYVAALPVGAVDVSGVNFSQAASYAAGGLGSSVQLANALRAARTAPHANFTFFTTDFTVTSCPGPGRATVAQDLRDVWMTKYAGSMTGGTTYVDGTNGSDANAGNITAPWQTIDKAIRTSNSGLVHVMPGTYDWTGFRYTDTQGDRPKMVVAPFGGVAIRVSGDTVSGATFTANGTYPNVWETTLVTANHVTRLLRTDRLDASGLPTPMPKQASLLGVNDAGYGWWYDSATQKLYVRDGTLNIDSAVKANLQAVYATGGDNALLVQSAKLYIENITLLRYPWSLKVLGQAVPEVWLKNCTVRYAESTSRLVQGGGCYSQGCTYYRSAADHANYTSASGTTAYGVEINDTTLFAGDVDSFGNGATQPTNPISTAQNKNSSSNHDGYVVRINGTHSGSFGPVIADTDGSYTWSLGTHAGYSFATGASRYGFIVQGSLARAWYDGCSTTGNSGLNSDTSAAAYTFNSAGPQVTSSSGTFSAYTPT